VLTGFGGLGTAYHDSACRVKRLARFLGFHARAIATGSNHAKLPAWQSQEARQCVPRCRLDYRDASGNRALERDAIETPLMKNTRPTLSLAADRLATCPTFKASGKATLGEASHVKRARKMIAADRPRPGPRRRGRW